MLNRKVVAPLAIPYLNVTKYNPSTGRNDLVHPPAIANDYAVVDVTVNIEDQNSVSGAVFDQLDVLSKDQSLPISRNEFIQMWKTLILKRVQDVYEEFKKIKCEHRVYIAPDFQVPAPLYDVLNSLGNFDSAGRGLSFHINPPEYEEEDTPEWWTVDKDIVKNWIQTMALIKSQYSIKSSPAIDAVGGSTLMITAIKDADGMRTVKAYTNEFQFQHAFVRFVNDDLFEEDEMLRYDNCHILAYGTKQYKSVVLDYIGAYVVATK